MADITQALDRVAPVSDRTVQTGMRREFEADLARFQAPAPAP
jgi:hypothetical protein